VRQKRAKSVRAAIKEHFFASKAAILAVDRLDFEKSARFGVKITFGRGYKRPLIGRRERQESGLLKGF
jgi:hypothetical protein